MLKVYEHNESVCCQKVRITLAEKQIDHELVNVSFEAREHRSPAFLAINPRGNVPVIIHDGRIITESTIIVEYLDEAFPGPQLMPDEPYWRARRRLWARRIDDEMHIPHITTISFNIAFAKLRKIDDKFDDGVGLRPEHRKDFYAGLDSEPMRRSLRAYQAFLNDINATLADNPFLAGPRFSLADIDVIPYIWRLHNLQLAALWKTMPRIQDWFDRVTDRKSFRETIIETALPEWTGSMKRNGEEAWPQIEKMLESA